jgi:hypothetical protein
MEQDDQEKTTWKRLSDFQRLGLDAMFYEDPYWNRSCIVQELTLAKRPTVMIGDSILSGQDFEYFCSGEDFGLLTICVILRWVMEQRAEQHGKSTIVDALNSTTRCQCADPRDMIYGLHSLFDHHDRIDVDYQKSIEHVFLTAVRRYFPSNASLLWYINDICVFYVARGMGLGLGVDLTTYHTAFRAKTTSESPEAFLIRVLELGIQS